MYLSIFTDIKGQRDRDPPVRAGGEAQHCPASSWVSAQPPVGNTVLGKLSFTVPLSHKSA